jgi:hypothetical protein
MAQVITFALTALIVLAVAFVAGYLIGRNLIQWPPPYRITTS